MKNPVQSLPTPSATLKTLLIYLTFILAFSGPKLKAQSFPEGFSNIKVANIFYPTSMAFAPDGRIFATEKAGKVKIIKNGAVLPLSFLELHVNDVAERGLLSINLDPDFANNNFVYIYYTAPDAPIHQRLSRFTANGDIVVPGSERIILDIEPSVNALHCGGGLVFGHDGKIYLGVGNDNVAGNSQDINTYKGKILRMNLDGSVPDGNPFNGSEAAKRVWALGLRNPWTLDIQPGTGKIFANDVGELTWEEINDVTQPGKNFGWPEAEGTSTNPAFTNPVYAYPRIFTGTDGGCAITGGTFFNPVSSNYPAVYTGKYFFLDYCSKWINYIDISGEAQKSNFATSLAGSENIIKTGPDGNLYYFSIMNNSLNKIVYSGTTISEIKNNDLIVEVFPNPNNGNFKILIDDISASGKVNVGIINCAGQEIYSREIISDRTGKEEFIELNEAIPAGIYFLKMTVGEKTGIVKMPVMR